MEYSIRRRSEKGGLPPGVAVHIGERKVKKTKYSIVTYDAATIEEIEVHSVDGCLPFLKQDKRVTWINVDGLHEAKEIEKMGEFLELHSLTIEDILNTEQRPKIELSDDYLFIVMKTHTYDSETIQISVDQLSLILLENIIVTFQEKTEYIFDSVLNRIRSRGKIRKLGADYLAYSLIDTIVDNFFKVLESVGENIEDIESELLEYPTSDTLHKIHRLKKEMILLRKSVWPLREIASDLERYETPLIKDETRIYLRDVYDHTIQVIDTVEIYRETISGMLEIYLSSINIRMNEVMKVLTIFAAIFIPLTFITGIYGMNFNTESGPMNMPELNWRYGYPMILGFMTAIAGAMLVFFKRKGWF